MTDAAPSVPGRRRKPPPRSWSSFLDAFHGERPGVTAEILGRSHADGNTPYQWLVDAIPPGGNVIDVACGNAPLAPLLGARWTGVDRSPAELACGRSPQARRVALGDATRLPFADRAVDTVVCSMALQVIEPLQDVVVEIARVLRPGGRLVALVPARRPLTLRDRFRYLGMIRALRDRISAPNDNALDQLPAVMREAGFEVVDDRCRRFAYRVDDPDIAERFVSSLYLRDVDARRVEAANRRARRWVGTSLGVPIRRFVCVLPTQGCVPPALSRS